MKSKILLLALTVAFLSSCTTSYKTGQTPDDVYYSPVRPQDEYVQTEKQDNRQYRNNDDAYYEDQYLRMKVRNRYRWSDIDDPYYYSRRYNFSSYNCCCFGNPWTPSSYWNNHFNPYYNSYIIINPKTTAYTAPRTFNLNSYNNISLTNNNYSNPKYNNPGSGSNNGYNNNNNNTYTSPRNGRRDNGSNSGNILREVFKSDNNSSSGGSKNNSSSSGSSGSSSSSSSSSSSAPVRRL